MANSFYTKVASTVLTIFLMLGMAQADRPGQSLGLKQHQIPVTWLQTPASQGPGDYARWLEHGGRKRYYEIHVPPSYHPGSPQPTLLMLHGGGGNPAGLRWQANMEKEADERGYILIYPAGTHHLFKDKGLFWNVGPKRKNAEMNGVDDVAFLEAVLDDAAGFFDLDPKRVYATGISNGAHMSYRMACESDRVAAIAPIAGVEKLGKYYQAPQRGVPIIHFHGKDDLWNTYNGGPTSNKSGFESRALPGLEEHIQDWVKANGCQINTSRGQRVGEAERIVYDKGKNGSEVIVWILHDGGHTWPSGRVSEAESSGMILGVKIGPSVGKVNQDISAAEEMLDFFDRHARP
jgi:polyhydroxybutyrate depolymerase